MVLYTLDAIVRNTLIRKGYSLHHYMQFLVYGAAGIREMYIDDLKVINTKLLTVDTNTSEVELPNDFVDYVQVGIEVGQKVRPLVESKKLNTLPTYTDTFEQTTYLQKQQDSAGNLILYNYMFPLFWNTVTWNDYGENIGRLFGWGNGDAPDTFVVDKARNVIKVNEQLAVDKIVLKYVSDGQSADAITQIPAEAYDTLVKYITWQHKEHCRSYSEGEKQRAKNEYLIARDVLRARKNDLTPEVVLRIFQRNYLAAARS